MLTYLESIGVYSCQDPRDDKWQWDVDKTRQFLDEEVSID